MTAARRAVTATLAAPVTAGWLSADTAPRAQSPRPPNIVLFLVDGLGYMDIGATNPDTFYETPHIDGLAAAGVRFTNATPPTRCAARCVQSARRAGQPQSTVLLDVPVEDAPMPVGHADPA